MVSRVVLVSTTLRTNTCTTSYVSTTPAIHLARGREKGGEREGGREGEGEGEGEGMDMQDWWSIRRVVEKMEIRYSGLPFLFSKRRY